MTPEQAGSAELYGVVCFVSIWNFIGYDLSCGGRAGVGTTRVTGGREKPPIACHCPES